MTNSEKLISEHERLELERLYQLSAEDLPTSSVIVCCAWCNQYLYGYGTEISHGICPECAERKLRHELVMIGGKRITLKPRWITPDDIRAVVLAICAALIALTLVWLMNLAAATGGMR